MIGCMDIARPSSRVEIVAAMRRVRVSFGIKDAINYIRYQLMYLIIPELQLLFDRWF